jgi:hypothetical protein
MGGKILGSYDLLSKVDAGESTFLARRRPLTADTDPLYAIRLVDAETAAWAADQVGRGWFPDLGPLVEVGRDSGFWFAVADVTDRPLPQTTAPGLEKPASSHDEPRRSSKALIASVAVVVILAIGGGAWALGEDGAEDGAEASAVEAPPEAGAVEEPVAATPEPTPEPTPEEAEAKAAPVVEAEIAQPHLSKRILRARARQAAARKARARRARAAAAEKLANDGTVICPRTGRVLSRGKTR